jgi:hypothetical protein
LAKTAVPVEREGRILFVAPDDPESGTAKLKEWNVKEGTVYDVAVVPNGGIRVSRDGRRLIAFSTGGGYYGDDPGERDLTLLVYAREAVGLPFGSPEKYVHKLKQKYLSGIVYDDVSGKFYLNYTAGHH